MGLCLEGETGELPQSAPEALPAPSEREPWVLLSRFFCQGSASEKRSWSIRCPPKPPLKPIACGEVIPAPPFIQARPRVVSPYFFYSFGPCTARFLVFFWKKRRKWGVQ